MIRKASSNRSAEPAHWSASKAIETARLFPSRSVGMQGLPQQNHLAFHLLHPPLATLTGCFRRSPSPPAARRAAPTQSPRRRRKGSCSAIDRKPLHRLHRRIRRVPELRRRTIHHRRQSHRRLVRSAARILNRSAAAHKPEHCDQQRRNLIRSNCLHALQNDAFLSPNTGPLKRLNSRLKGNLSFLGGRSRFQAPTALERLCMNTRQTTPRFSQKYHFFPTYSNVCLLRTPTLPT